MPNPALLILKDQIESVETEIDTLRSYIASLDDGPKNGQTITTLIVVQDAYRTLLGVLERSAEILKA